MHCVGWSNSSLFFPVRPATPQEQARNSTLTTNLKQAKEIHQNFGGFPERREFTFNHVYALLGITLPEYFGIGSDRLADLTIRLPSPEP